MSERFPEYEWVLASEAVAADEDCLPCGIDRDFDDLAAIVISYMSFMPEGSKIRRMIPIVVARVDEGPTREHARLIAAAPDMLDVAHMVLACATVEMPGSLVRAAEAAIRKAEGGAK